MYRRRMNNMNVTKAAKISISDTEKGDIFPGRAIWNGSTHFVYI